MKNISSLICFVFISLQFCQFNLFSQQLSWHEISAFTVDSENNTIESDLSNYQNSYLMTFEELISNDIGYFELTNFMSNGGVLSANSEVNTFTLYLTFESTFSLARVHQSSYYISYYTIEENGSPVGYVKFAGPNGIIDLLSNVTLSTTDTFKIEKTESNKVRLKYNSNEYLITDNFIENAHIAIYNTSDNFSFTYSNQGFRSTSTSQSVDAQRSNKNWVMARSYDNSGQSNGATISYFNNIGMPIQSQTRDFETGKIWVNETRYDNKGRPALATSSAPLNGSLNKFTYRYGFIKGYNEHGITSTQLNADPENPPLLDPTPSPGTLNWYYSESNTLEPFQDIAHDRPYTRTVYDELNAGSIRGFSGGKEYDTNSNGQNDGFLDRYPQGYSYTVPGAQELYYAFGQDYFDGPIASGNKEVILKSYKTVSIDSHGNEVVNFTDSEGKVLATARSGGNTNYDVVATINDTQKYTDVHIPKGITNSQITYLGGGPSGYVIWDLRRGVQVNSTEVTGGNVYRIYHNAAGNPKTYITPTGQITYFSAKGVKYPVNYYDYSLNYYDKSGKLKKTSQPLGFDPAAFNLATGTPNHGMISTYSYNASGELTNTSSPDEGDAEFLYREDGQIRFSRNTLQLANDEFSYTNYDDKGRPIESGVSQSTIPYWDITITGTPTFTTESSLSSSNGTITKTGASNWLNSGFVSQESTSTGNFSVTFQINANAEVAIGVSEVDQGSSYDTVDYAFYSQNNQISFYNNGNSLTKSSATYTQTDTLAIERIDNTIYFKKNDQVLYQASPWLPSGSFPSMIIDGAMYSQDAVISNITLNELSSTETTTVPPLDDWVVNPITCKERLITVYDVDDNAGMHAVLYSGLGGPGAEIQRSQRFLSGNVSKTYTLTPETATTWYSYDVYGRVDWMVQYINGLGAKTIDYEYDEATGQISKVIFQRDEPTDRFVHKYLYNERGQLVTVETSWDNINFTEHARYEYYQSGELKRTILAEGLQGTDYIYALNGQLKAINHPGLNSSNDPGDDLNDAFGLILDYNELDYTRNGTNGLEGSPSGIDRYDGIIKGTRWGTQGLNSGGNQNGLLYQYNSNKWLTGATFGNVNGNIYTSGATPDYSVSGINYDANGNITTLKRTRHYYNGGNLMDDLQYNYDSGTNQLEYVADTSGNTEEDGDIKSQNPGNYIYNSIGQLIENNQDNMGYKYLANGLVKEVYSTSGSSDAVYFYYNDRGHRVKKEIPNSSGPNNSTYYVRDASGQVLAIYNQLFHNGEPESFIEYPIYGNSRLGVADQDNSFTYELTDHLGNVRAVIKRNGTVTTVLDEDFNNGINPPWSAPENTILTIVNNRLKISALDNIPNPVKAPFNVTQGYTYSVRFHVDLDETPNRLDVYIDDGGGVAYEPLSISASTNGEYTFNYTAIETETVYLTFDLDQGFASVIQNQYYLDDVKVTDVTTSNIPIMLAYKDYYPFGMAMPNRNIEGEYRYAFQGQEKDEETGMEAFELRLWDARIGRWLSPDPYGQFHSPYLGIGNNPINFIDPDGGYCYDAQGRQIPCPDGYGQYEGPTSENITLGGDLMISNAEGLNMYNALEETVVVANKNKKGHLKNIETYGQMALGATIGGHAAGLFKDAVPNIPIAEFKLRSYNPKTGYVTLESYPGQVFEQGTDDAIKGLKTVRVAAKGLTYIGNVAGYSTAIAEMFEGRYVSAGTEAWSATVGIMVGAEYGSIYGVAWSVGWEGGRYFTNHSESYNRMAFGIYSDIYIQRALEFSWDVELNSTQLHWAAHRGLY